MHFNVTVWINHVNFLLLLGIYFFLYNRCSTKFTTSRWIQDIKFLFFCFLFYILTKIIIFQATIIKLYVILY